MKRILMLMVLTVAGGTTFAAEQELPQGVIRLDETVISGTQELPKVLYILPWRDPAGLPDIELETGGAEEKELFRRLYPPAYRRELTYFESLEATQPKE